MEDIDFAIVKRALQYKQYDPETRKHAYSVQLLDRTGKAVYVIKCTDEENMREKHAEVLMRLRESLN